MKTLKEIVADFLKDVHSPCSEEDLLEALQRAEKLPKPLRKA